MDTARRNRIIELLSRGVPKQLIAEVEGVSRPTFYKWLKDDPTILEEVERIQDETIESASKIVKEREVNRAEELAEKLQQYGDRRQKSATALQNQGLRILQKLANRIEAVDPQEIRIRDLAALCRATADMIEKGAAAEADALGIEQMMQALINNKSFE